MKNLGIVLLVLGALALIYGGISYTRNRTVIEMGSMDMTVTERRSVPIPAVLGLVVLIGGVAFLVVDRRRA